MIPSSSLVVVVVDVDVDVGVIVFSCGMITIVLLNSSFIANMVALSM